MSLHIRREIPNWHESFALLAVDEPVDTAVIFVHGFNGDADSTWIYFQALVDRCSGEYPHWQRADLFFWEYESVKHALRVVANKFRQFVTEVFPTPPDSLYRIELSPSMLEIGIEGDVMLREGFSGYRKLILVGHSEGAVLIRLVIRDLAANFSDEIERQVSKPRKESVRRRRELRPGEPTSIELSAVESQVREIEKSLMLKTPDYRLLNSQLCLFAPAHCGSTITGSWGALLESPGIALFSRPLMRWSTAQVDLMPTSPMLHALRRDTEKLAKERPLLSALRANIVWGEEERVVTVDRYRYDFDGMVPNQNHVSICKPTLAYKVPLGFVSYDESVKPATI